MSTENHSYRMNMKQSYARALRVLLEGSRKTVRGSRLLKILADAIRSRGLEVVECSLDKRAQLEVRL
jgi:hypothetical protein